nr:molybdopterin dinucleotide binding domain-containing protein [Desulfuribacillus stibiiarsenatis]
MARRFHAQWKFTDPEEIFEEIRLLVPQYHGIRYDRINQQGIQWPCPTLEHAGTPYLHKGGFARGKGRFTPIDYRVSGETADEEYPFILTTGRNLYHWHTGSMSRKVQGLEHILSEEHMQIHPEDAILYNLQENSKVQVTSRRGSVVTNLEITDMVPRGTLFMTFHFSETLTNTLTSSHRDPVSKIPEAKVTAVNIKKVSI